MAEIDVRFEVDQEREGPKLDLEIRVNIWGGESEQ